ncbi:MAG: hypothetical protein QM783_02050 [Phycisphaerales bacterium]
MDRRCAPLSAGRGSTHHGEEDKQEEGTVERRAGFVAFWRLEGRDDEEGRQEGEEGRQKTAKKTGLTKSVVKKKVVKKLKEVGVAMARAAMDELMPADQAGRSQEGQGGQRNGRQGGAAANPR